MDDLAFKQARILIVDDQPANVRVLERLLQQMSYPNVCGLTDSREVARLVEEWSPDLILLDLLMPYIDGFGILEQLKGVIQEKTYLPILVLTADITTEAKQRALSAGAKDFLTKPFDATEVLLRIRNLLQTRFLYLQLQTQNELLDAKVRERTHDLEAAQIEIVERLAQAAEFRDDDTGQHTQRVGWMAARIGHELGLAHDQVELLRRAAPLHDVGKIGIPDAILLKPGRLTAEEFEIMKGHSVIGANLLAGSRNPLLQLAEEIAHSHHERWDGRGYPLAIAGDDIPLVGRIVAIADVFDALTHERPYKQAWPVEDAIAEIRRQHGLQFDPRVVDVFLHLYDVDGAIFWDSEAPRPNISVSPPEQPKDEM